MNKLLTGILRDCFENEIKDYHAEVKGVVLYMNLSLEVGKGNSLIAYGETIN